MSTREKIQELDAEIKALYATSASIQEQAWLKTEERDKLVAATILEEKMLTDSTWDLDSGSGAKQMVGGSGISNKDGITIYYTGTTLDAVMDLARTDYHSTFTLQQGISLRFDDNDISLRFQESKMMLPFVQKHGLIISGTDIRDKLAGLKRQVAALEAVCHAFKL